MKVVINKLKSMTI